METNSLLDLQPNSALEKISKVILRC